MPTKNYVTVTTVCVAISIGFYSLLTDFLAPKINDVPWAAPLISATATIGFYVTIYRILMWIYDRFVKDIVNPDEAIAGEWFYRYIINEDESNSRYGIYKIVRQKGKLLASAVNYDPNRQRFTSHTSSEFINIDKNNILMVYNATGIIGRLDSAKGLFFLKIVGVPPESFHGYWADILPIKNHGSITFIRRNKDTDAILETIGYPLDGPINSTGELTKFIVQSNSSK